MREGVKRRDARTALARRGALGGDMAPKAKRTSEKEVAADLASMTDAEIAARKAELRAVLAAKGDAHAARSSAPAAPEADDSARGGGGRGRVRARARARPGRRDRRASAQPRRGPQAPRGAKAQAARARGDGARGGGATRGGGEDEPLRRGRAE